MSRAHSQISEAQEIVPGVFRIEKVAPSGWCWNMFLLRLRGGGFLVHSPTRLDDRTFERVEAVGEPKVLLAPNNYHHLSLAAFRERYPQALAVAAREAIPRLQTKGHRGLVDIDAASGVLPKGAAWLRCEGAKSGEVWLSLPGPDGHRIWVICDAYFNVERETKGLLGLALRGLRVVPGLQISLTYRLLGLGDVKRYKAWALATIEREKPRLLLCSHGEPARGEDLPERMARLIEKRL